MKRSDRNLSLGIRISCENQERMRKHIDPSFAPLFALKGDQTAFVRFEHKSFTCTFKDKKQGFSYRDIQKAETWAEGLIIYLTNGRYLSIAAEHREKHNTRLYDIVAFLKRHCRTSFSEIGEIDYPDDGEARYSGKDEPLLQCSFSLSDGEIRRLLLYDYLIDEKMLTLILPILIGFSLSILLQASVLAILAGILTLQVLILSVMFLREKNGYVKNHKGLLRAALYDDLLVIGLHDTDLELEYRAMKRRKALFGLWRLQCGEFFVLVLPQRIEKENAAFFEALYQKTSFL